MIRMFAALLVLLSAHGVASQAVAQGNQDMFACADSVSLDRATRRPAPSDCRQAGRGLQAQVTGGEPAGPDERYTAAIFFVDENGMPEVCSGVLLDSRHVLTAGHCGCGMSGSYRVTFKQSAQQGDQSDEGTGIERGPILLDPMACVLGIAPGKDLALLRLSEDMFDKANKDKANKNEFGYPIFALAADFREKMKRGMSLKVVGYGETETGGLATRMRAMVPILTPDCFEPLFNLSCASFQEMIMADRTGSRIPRDTCGGDSGGPVFIRTTVKLPMCGQLLNPFELDLVVDTPAIQDVLVAVTSRAAPFTQSLAGGHCGGGGIYTLIGRQSVYAWFEANHVKPQRCVSAK